MKTLQYIFIVLMFFIIGCVAKELIQEEFVPEEPAQEEPTQESPAPEKLVQENLVPEKPVQEASVSIASSNVIPCDKDNFIEYVSDFDLMDKHIEQYKTGCNLQGVNWSNKNVRFWDLRYANFQGANLYGIDLTSANLSYADLRGVNMNYARIGTWDFLFFKPTKLTNAKYNSETVFSEDFSPEEKGMIEVN